MKRLVLAASLTLALISPAAAKAAKHAAPKAPAASLEDTLIAMEKQSWAAWQNHDSEFYKKFLSEDHVEVGLAGPAYKNDVVAGIASGCTVASYATDTFKFVQFNADTALLTYSAAQDTKCGGKPVPSPVWVSSLYVKRGGKWVNALYQQTFNPR